MNDAPLSSDTLNLVQATARLLDLPLDEGRLGRVARHVEAARSMMTRLGDVPDPPGLAAPDPFVPAPFPPGPAS